MQCRVAHAKAIEAATSNRSQGAYDQFLESRCAGSAKAPGNPRLFALSIAKATRALLGEQTWPGRDARVDIHLPGRRPSHHPSISRPSAIWPV
jgi:hypothetical protein